MYATAGGNDKNNNNGKDRLDEMYYQRFMGGGVPMNDADVTDDIALAAEIADVDPGSIDSLRRVGAMEEKTSSKTSIGGGSGGFLNSVRRVRATNLNTSLGRLIMWYMPSRPDRRLQALFLVDKLK